MAAPSFVRSQRKHAPMRALCLATLLIFFVLCLLLPCEASVTGISNYYAALTARDPTVFALSSSMVRRGYGVETEMVDALGSAVIDTSSGFPGYTNTIATAYRMNTLSEMLVAFTVLYLQYYQRLPFGLSAAIPSAYLPSTFVNATYLSSPFFPDTPITMVMLLTHTSTINEVGYSLGFAQSGGTAETMTNDAFVETVFSGMGSSVFTRAAGYPGTSAAYSVSRMNTALVSFIVDRILEAEWNAAQPSAPSQSAASPSSSSSSLSSSSISSQLFSSSSNSSSSSATITRRVDRGTETFYDLSKAACDNTAEEEEGEVNENACAPTAIHASTRSSTNSPSPLNVGTLLLQEVLGPLALTSTFLIDRQGRRLIFQYPAGENAANMLPYIAIQDVATNRSATSVFNIHAAYLSDYMMYTSTGDLMNMVGAFFSTAGVYRNIGLRMLKQSVDIRGSLANTIPYATHRMLGLYNFSATALCVAMVKLNGNASSSPYCDFDETVMESDTTPFGSISTGVFSQVAILCYNAAGRFRCSASSISFLEANLSNAEVSVTQQFNGAMGVLTALMAATVGLPKPTIQPNTTLRPTTPPTPPVPANYGLFVFIGVAITIIVVVAASYVTDYFIQPAPPAKIVVPVPVPFQVSRDVEEVGDENGENEEGDDMAGVYRRRGEGGDDDGIVSGDGFLNGGRAGRGGYDTVPRSSAAARRDGGLWSEVSPTAGTGLLGSRSPKRPAHVADFYRDDSDDSAGHERSSSSEDDDDGVKGSERNRRGQRGRGRRQSQQQQQQRGGRRREREAGSVDEEKTSDDDGEELDVEGEVQDGRSSSNSQPGQSRPPPPPPRFDAYI